MPSICETNAISVGVTGHLNVAGAQVEEVNSRVIVTLKAIRAAVETHCGRSNASINAAEMAVEFNVISCLAAGADQIVAMAGQELGFGLQAVLPGPPEKYKQVFKLSDPQATQTARERFDHLLGAAGDNVHRIPSEFPLDQTDQARSLRHQAYAEATQYMLQRCDLLIAIVDILNRDDLGESAVAIRGALRLGRLIAWIDPSRPQRLRWLSHLSEVEFAEILSQPSDKRVVPELAKNIHLMKEYPPKKPDPNDDSPVLETLAEKAAWIVEAKRQATDAIGEKPPADRSWAERWLSGVWGRLIEQHLPKNLELHTEADAREHHRQSWLAEFRFTLRSWRGEFWLGLIVVARVLLGVGGLVVRTLRGVGEADKPPKPSLAPQSAADEFRFFIIDEIENERKWPAALARHYAGLHRSSFLLITTLGVVAVGFAALAAVVRSSSEWPARSFAATELVVIILMLLLYFLNRIFRWQERSLDFRFLAERLRHSIPSLLVGGDHRESNLPAQYSNLHARKTWVGVCTQQILNRIEEKIEVQVASLSPGKTRRDWQHDPFYLDGCRKYIADDWLKKQADYQISQAARNEALHLGLESLQLVFLVLTVVVCITHLLPLDKPLLMFLAVVLPMMSAAAVTLGVQSEMIRQRDRQIAMFRAICRRHALMDQIPSSDPERLQSFVAVTAEEIMNEVAEWRVVFKFRPINAPG